MGIYFGQKTDLKDRMRRGWAPPARAWPSRTTIFAQVRAKMQTNLASSSKASEIDRFQRFFFVLKKNDSQMFKSANSVKKPDRIHSWHFLRKGCGLKMCAKIYFPEQGNDMGAITCKKRIICILVFLCAIFLDCFRYIAIFRRNPSDFGSHGHNRNAGIPFRFCYLIADSSVSSPDIYTTQPRSPS